MKTVARLSLATLALAAAAVPALAQAADAWAAFSPDGEGFTVLMPGRPLPARPQQLRAGGLQVAGRRYEAAGADGAAGGGVDYTRPLSHREVTQRARVTLKPEPPYTEGARKFHVKGVVRIRAVLAATGEVEQMVVLKGLPHGLTLRALDALRKVKFEPARKDGRPVSQYAVFEYNFNFY